MQRFQWMLFIALGLLALGLAIAATLQVFIGLKPLVKLRRELATVREGTASRIESRFPSEVQPLVDEFNLVLQNTSQIVQRARTQAGNLAHALKTPLSIMSNAAREEQTAFGHMVAEQVSLAQRHVDHHLARARAAAAVRTPGSGLGLAIVRDLAQAYGGSVRAYSSDHGGLGVELRLPG